MSQLHTGINVEKEHKSTYNFLKNYAKNHSGNLPPQKVFYKKIALNHIRENKNYYTKLKRARL